MECREDIIVNGKEILGRELTEKEIDVIEFAMQGIYDMYCEVYDEDVDIDALFNEDFYDRLKEVIDENRLKEVCVSVKVLYDKYVRDNYCELEDGYKIEHTYQEETDTHYYDLKKADGTIACMDGENCEVSFEKDKDRYKFINKENMMEFYLSKEEFAVAVFGFEQEKLLEKNSEVNMVDVNIISLEECEDEAYGASLVQYSLGENHVSFAFCDVDVSGNDYDLDEIKKAVSAQIKDDAKQPLWSDLSETLLKEILDSPFDMHFVEYDDDDWSEEKAEEVWKEADEHSLGAVACGEDGCYLTFYAGAMSEINWSGHTYYGTPCLEDVIISSDKIEELKKQEGIFEYVDSYGGTNYVRFTMDMYNENDNLYLGLESYDPEFDCFEPYGGITVNVRPLPYLHSTVDTNNNSSALISFLIENGIGEPTGDYLPSGFCNFPVFKFSEEKLMELCPKEFSQYRQTHGMAPSLESRISESVTKQSAKESSEKKMSSKKNDKVKENGRD